MIDPLVDVAWLAAHSGRPGLVVCDVRWYLKGKVGRDEYLAGHLPGAFFVDLDAELSGDKARGPGRHPLPSDAQLQALASRLGIGSEIDVVVYDDAGGAIAARLWFLLTRAGHPRTYVLDGGLRSFTAAGGALVRDVPADVGRTDVKLRLDRTRIVDADAVAGAVARGALLTDARAPERYSGLEEPVDPRAGHIPGAVSLPTGGNLGPDGRFLPVASLAKLYEDAGLSEGRETIASCGSGVTACHTLLALARLGRWDAKLYEGSFSDWARDPARVVATGGA